MKFETNNTLLAQAVNTAATAASAGEFSGILIQAGEDFVRIIGAQGTLIQIGVSLPADIEEPGVCALRYDDLISIVRVLPKNQNCLFSVEATTRKAKITSGYAKFELDTVDTQNFHIVDISEAEQIAQPIPEGAWSKAIEGVSSAARIDSGMEFLHCVNITSEENFLRFGASDASRVHACWVPGEATLPQRNTARPSINIPLKIARDSAKIAGKNETHIAAGRDWFYLATEDSYIRSSVMDVDFPNIDGFLVPGPNSITLERAILSGMLNRVRAGMDKNSRNPSIIFEIKDNKICMYANGSQKSASEEFPIDGAQDISLRIGLNAAYLHDAIVANKSQAIRISFTNNVDTNPIHLDNGAENSDHHALIMPVRIQSQS